MPENIPEIVEKVPAYLKEMQLILTNGLIVEAQKQALTMGQIIAKMKASGMTIGAIEKNLINDLVSGGQIFGDFRKAIKATVKGGMEDVARGALYETFQDAEKWDWLGITDGKICPTCLTRHNMPARSYKEWQAIGLPGSGATLCGKNDRCVLVPAGAIEKEPGGFKR